MKVVLDRVLPKQLRSLGVSDSAIVCERIENALLLLTDEPRIETADSIFKRIAT
jgi:hypothetical protein